jgi:exonuclease VII small subunit
MEVIGATASALTLIAAISQTTKKLFQICRRYADASEDTMRVNQHLSLIQSQAQLLGVLSEDIANGSLPVSELETRLIQQILNGAATRLSDVLQAYSGDDDTSGTIRSKLEWSFRRGPELERIIKRLNSAESSLSLALQVLQM